MSDQEVDETELAFQRLREVLSAPDRRGWRRLRRARAEPDDVATREEPPSSSKAATLLAAPLLGAALVLMISVVRPGAGGGPRPTERSSAVANHHDHAAVAPGEAEAAEAAPPAPRPVGRSERVWPAEPVSVEGTTVSIGDRRWAVGATGDVVIVGDWDCDGAPTPAVLRPGDGSLHVFDRWAGAGEAATARRIGAFPGAVTAAAAGCGSAIVTTALGEQRRVETAAASR